MMPAACACPMRVEYLSQQVRGAFGFDRPVSLHELIERFAGHELHHHQQVFVGPMKLVDGGNRRMIELRQHARFRAEAFHHIAVGELGIEDLDRDFAVEGFVDGPVDRAHAAAAELCDDTILADGSANHKEMFRMRPMIEMYVAPPEVSIRGPEGCRAKRGQIVI